MSIQYIGLGAAIAFIVVAIVVIVKHIIWERQRASGKRKNG